MVLSEVVADRAIVSVWDLGGPRARNGNATDDSKKARGFVNTGGGVGDTVTVFFIGILSGLSGLTIGADYFLSTTPGGITTAAPSTTGGWDQIVGWAITTTDLFFQPLRGLGL